MGPAPDGGARLPDRSATVWPSSTRRKSLGKGPGAGVLRFRPRRADEGAGRSPVGVHEGKGQIHAMVE